MKILIFGGGGFLGSYLVENLLRKRNEVTIYTRHKIDNIYFFSDRVNIIFGDYALENNFHEIVKGYDYVYQLISASVPSINDPIKDIDWTIKPTLRLMDACVKNNIKKVIFFSSGGTVYGIPNSIPIKENHLTNPISSYGIQKLIIEKYLEFYYQMYGLDYTILRIANPYGPRQKAFSNQGLIANILAKYLTHQTIEIWGDGSTVRDYIYVEDVIEAAVEVLRYKGNEKIFNLASGKGYSINEIIKVIENIVGHKINVCNLKARKQDVPINILDIDLIEKELKWYPKIDLNEGIKKMIQSWNSKNQNFNKI